MFSRKTVSLLFISLVFAASSATAGQLTIPSTGFLLDLPEGWAAYGQTSQNVSTFANAEHTAFLQVFNSPPGSYANVQAFYDAVRQRLRATGDSAPFTFNSYHSILADLTFSANGTTVRGYAIFIDNPAAETLLLTFSPVASYKGVKDQILSALDSFAFTPGERLHPGPVAQFYYPNSKRLDPANQKKYSEAFGASSLSFSIDPSQNDASQMVIEREARLLVQASGKNVDTWKRYYRVIARDNYDRLDPVYKALAARFKGRHMTREQIASSVLSWIQSWDYVRSGTLADLTDPVDAVLDEKGDCDSRGLVYDILLRHFGIGNVLFVSTRYSHSVCGVDVSGAGARISADGTRYLLAETTAHVRIGLIAADMTDPTAWLPVEFYAVAGK